MTDAEQLTQLYHAMYRGMVHKDLALLDQVLADSFVLRHMTGMRQTKQEYMKAIAGGTLDYSAEQTERIAVTVDRDTARLVGRSRVTAAVFGSGRHIWRLQLELTAVRRNGKWAFTEANASSYSSGIPS